MLAHVPDLVLAFGGVFVYGLMFGVAYGIMPDPGDHPEDDWVGIAAAALWPLALPAMVGAYVALWPKRRRLRQRERREAHSRELAQLERELFGVED